MEVFDSTDSTIGGRIPQTTYFRTLWKDGILLEYYCSSGLNTSTELKKKDKSHFDMKDKIAIARHKRIMLKKLGLLKEQEKKKIIFIQTHPRMFFVYDAIEKDKIFKSSYRCMDKRACVIWTEEKQKLIEQYDELKEKMQIELDLIEEKIRRDDKQKKQGGNEKWKRIMKRGDYF